MSLLRIRVSVVLTNLAPFAPKLTVAIRSEDSHTSFTQYSGPGLSFARQSSHCHEPREQARSSKSFAGALVHPLRDCGAFYLIPRLKLVLDANRRLGTLLFMQITPFRIEEYMGKYEFSAKYLLSSSDARIADHCGVAFA